MARTDHEHNTAKLLRTINDLADQSDRLTGRVADLLLAGEALELALNASMAYGKAQYARAQAAEAELAEVRENFAAARPVDSRDARNARLRSM